MFKISLPNFEGPFDLLLYFIKRDEVNIYDIPIVRITEEFLNYVRVMQIFDLELAGEFLVMAANLMYIKTQMLLPKPRTEDGEEIEDPRTQLVQRLLEYKKFKEASGELKRRAEDNRYTYYRQLFAQDRKISRENGTYVNATIFDLLTAFKRAMERKRINESNHVVKFPQITTEQMIERIISSLEKKGRLSFFSFVNDIPKNELIVTFLAILDLMKSQIIYIKQEGNFDDIIIAQVPQENYQLN